MKKVTKTHNGKETATTVINDGFALYFSKANKKSVSTYLTLGATNPETGKFTRVPQWPTGCCAACGSCLIVRAKINQNPRVTLGDFLLTISTLSIRCYEKKAYCQK
jgi:hypothetical protein